MKDILKQLFKDEKLCEFYFYGGDADVFCVGFLSKIDGDFILIQSVAPDGSDDGWVYQPVRLIATVRIDTRYLHNIQALMKSKGNGFRASEYKGEGLDGLLSFVKSKGYICTFELDNDEERSVCGKISAVNKETVTIAAFDGDGYGDGTAFVRKEDVSGVSINTADEQKIKFLCENRDE